MECGCLLEFFARALLRLEDAHREPKPLVDNPDRLDEIRIVRHDDGNLVITEGVKQQICGDIHVRAFLLRLVDLDKSRPASAPVDQHRPDRGREEGAVVAGQIRGCCEGAQLCLLPLWLRRIGRPRIDQRREVPNPVDAIVGEDQLAEPTDIESLVPGILQAAVVEIEAVDVHVGSHQRQIS